MGLVTEMSEEIHALRQENARLKLILTRILKGDAGQGVLYRLSHGQSTDTDDGKAWIEASEICVPFLRSNEAC